MHTLFRGMCAFSMSAPYDTWSLTVKEGGEIKLGLAGFFWILRRLAWPEGLILIREP